MKILITAFLLGWHLSLFAAETNSANRPPSARVRAEVKALRWLQQQQKPDGSWISPPSDIAGTGLAVLAFLSRSETPDSKEFGKTVTRGLEFLVQSIDENGLVKDKSRYAQGVVTLALAEAYSMTMSPALREPLAKSVKTNSVLLVEADGFELAWLTLSIYGAQLAGIDVPAEVMVTARNQLWKRYREDGQFADAKGRLDPELTGAYVYCLQMLGNEHDPRVKKALDLLKKQRMDWRETTSPRAWESWFFVTQAMLWGGGPYWQHWSHEQLASLLESQQEDGHWVSPPKAKGELAIASSPLHATAINCASFPPFSIKPRYIDMERNKPSLPE